MKGRKAILRRLAVKAGRMMVRFPPKREDQDLELPISQDVSWPATFYSFQIPSTKTVLAPYLHATWLFLLIFKRFDGQRPRRPVWVDELLQLPFSSCQHWWAPSHQICLLLSLTLGSQGWGLWENIESTVFPNLKEPRSNEQNDSATCWWNTE